MTTLSPSTVVDFVFACKSESGGDNPTHFSQYMTSDYTNAYIKNTPVSRAEFLKESSKKKALSACLRRATYDSMVEYDGSKYDGYLTKKVWAKFRANIRAWDDAHNPVKIAERARKESERLADIERGRQKRIAKEFSERARMGDDAFNKRMHTQKDEKLNSQKDVTESEIVKFKEWYEENKSEYLNPATNTVVQNFSTASITYDQTKVFYVKTSNDAARAIHSLQHQFFKSTDTGEYSSVSSAYAVTMNILPISKDGRVSQAYCTLGTSHLPINGADRYSSTRTVRVLSLNTAGKYATTDNGVFVHKLFPKQWERFEYLNPKKSIWVNVEYDIEDLVESITLYGKGLKVQICVDPFSKNTTSFVDINKFLTRCADNIPSTNTVKTSLDDRLQKMQSDREQKSKAAKENGEKKAAAEALTKSYSAGLIDVKTYTKALKELNN